MTLPRIAARFALAVSLVTSMAAPGRGQPASTTVVSGTPSMHASLERTIFKLDVLDVEMRFDDTTKRRIEAIARGPGDPDMKKDAIARAAFEADEVFVRVVFSRDVPLSRFIDAVRDDLEAAERAGMIDARLRESIADGLPRWFAAIEERGFEQGDRLLYRGSNEQLRTVLVADGQLLLDQTDRGAEPKRALLGAYFAEGSTFRESLVDSVFE